MNGLVQPATTDPSEMPEGCVCRSLALNHCTRSALLIEHVEELIAHYYQHIQITPAMRQALAGMLHHEFDRLISAEANELENLTANQNRLESDQIKLVQAHYADAIPLTVLKREQDRILAVLDQVNRRIGRPPRRVRRRPSPPRRRPGPARQLR